MAAEARASIIREQSAGSFAAGDLRAGSMKRVASAVAEEAISVSFVHFALAEP
jgi:thioredoxin reductase (NADPH)